VGVVVECRKLEAGRPEPHGRDARVREPERVRKDGRGVRRAERRAARGRDRAAGREDEHGPARGARKPREPFVHAREEARPRLAVLRVVSAARPAGHGGVEGALEGPRERRGLEVAVELRVVRPARLVDAQDLLVVELVPRRVLRPRRGETHRFEARSGGVALPAHGARDDRAHVPDPSAERLAGDPGLPPPGLREDVVIGGAEGRLAVTDEDDGGHARGIILGAA
jgi:hypothetical protein